MGVQSYSLFIAYPESSKEGLLVDLIPRDLAGWEVQDIPLSETEAALSQAQKTLNMDDFVYRTYKRDKFQFSVYAAYWEPGKMPIRLVNAHNPDRCWSKVGWKCTKQESGFENSLDEMSFKPAQWRAFEKDDFKQYVLFWHIVGGKVHSYKQFSDRPPLTVALLDLWHHGMNQKREQYFIRVSSERPLDNLFEESGFKMVMKNLWQLCLRKEPDSLERELS